MSAEKTEVTTEVEDQKLVEFRKTKAELDKHVEVLKAIKVTDKNSLAVANQQLSVAKVMLKGIDDKHKVVKEEALRFCQSADKAKKELRSPMDLAVAELDQQIIDFDKAEIARLLKEAQALEKEQVEFENRGIDQIHNAKSTKELADIYQMYIIEFPEKYHPEMKDRIKALGTAKFNAIKAADPTLKLSLEDVVNAIAAYDTMHGKLTGKIVEGAAPEVVTPPVILVPSFSAVSNVKKDWDFEIVDLSKLPLDWIAVNEKSVKEYMKANKDVLAEGQVIGGLKFKQVASVKHK